MKFSKLILLIFILCACVKTETISLEEQSKEWLTGSDNGDIFEMVDENSISQSWRLSSKRDYLNESSSAILFVTTDRTYRQRTYETFRNDVLGQFSVSLEPYFSKGDDYISFSTDRINVTFSLKDQSIRNLYVDNSNGETNHWNYQFDEPLNSEPILVESLEIRGETYAETLIFRLEDFQYGLSSNDIIAFYFTKNEGLVYLELKNGLKYYRK